jgi:hypothetical protein
MRDLLRRLLGWKAAPGAAFVPGLITLTARGWIMGENIREVKEGTKYQGEDESIAYMLDVSAVGDNPTTVSVVVKSMATGLPVTATVMPVNVPTVSGNVITLSPLKLLTAGVLYRVEVKYTIGGGNIVENYFYVQGQM